MEELSEAEKFDNAMDKLLKVSPQVVKAAMEQEKLHRAEERKAKRVSSDRVANDRKA